MHTKQKQLGCKKCKADQSSNGYKQPKSLTNKLKILVFLAMKISATQIFAIKH